MHWGGSREIEAWSAEGSSLNDPQHFMLRYIFLWCFIVFKVGKLLSCQPRVTVTSCFVYKAIRVLQSIDHLCINPIRRIGLIHK